jgi:hypothetical protein
MRKIEEISGIDYSNQAALLEELNSLKGKIKVMEKLVTKNGFYSYYLNEIKNFISSEEAFTYVNSLYCQHFGQCRFNSYEEFKLFINLNSNSLWKA